MSSSSSFFLILEVKLMDLETIPDTNYQKVISNKRDNILQFTMMAAPAVDSASVRGTNLWQLAIWGSDNPVGEGPHYGETTAYNLNSYQRSVSVIAGSGGVLQFGTVETMFDMSGLGCDEVRYVCAKLQRDPDSSPNFELVGVPNERVLTQCFPVRCAG